MYEQLPSKLKKRPQFCNWRLEERDDDLTKVPYRSNGKRANPTDPQCFTDFDTVCAAHDKYDGIGIGIFDDLFAIDIDHCVTDGVLSPMAQDIIETMDCYTEYSPSGKGIRIIGLISELRYDKARYYINNRKLGLEVYVAGYTNKFVTLTGNALRESDLVDRSKELMTILEKYMVKPAQFQEVIRDVPGSYLSDEAVIAKALASKQGEKFRSLREGNIPEGMSHSEADLSYCTMLAFWCGGDTYQMDRLFQESGLMRDKWNREDYRTATLNKAVAMTTEFYKPLAISDAREDFSIPASFLAQVKPENNDRYPWTEIGYGRLFADCYRDVARFVPERKSWYCYRNGIWAADTGNLQTMELCKDLADALMLHALTIRNERQRRDYIKLCAAKWQIRRTRETILRDAQSIHPISIQEFDSDPYVFNCRNGTLHLDTMEFASHNPEDRLTKISPVDYDPNAHCDRFLTFVDEITSGDTDKGRFLQKMLGYGMSGDTRFECLFILYGATTRNGKGTLCESVLKVLGTYGCTARPETLSMKANANSHNPSEDIARLAGVRFANISEPGKGMVLNAAQVKSMTGNDTLNARFLHENSFDFIPQFKLYINTNYLPVINDMTLFSSGRVVTIPFDRHFEESEQDKSLKAEFRKPENQSAILNWLVEGYRILMEEGMKLPESVIAATDAYREDSDKVWQFVQERLDEAPAMEVRTSEVYENYRGWCSENGCYPENSRNFNQALRSFATVVRKRPKRGGGATTMLLGYRVRATEFLSA